MASIHTALSAPIEAHGVAERARRVAAMEPELPPGAVKDGTQGRILQAALKIFAERGFHGGSIRDIAKETGISPATIYSHYPSKDHILAELLRIAHVGILVLMRQALDECGDDPREQAKAVVRALVKGHTDYPMLGVVANTELHVLGPDLVEPALSAREQAEIIGIEIVHRGVELGIFDAEDPAVIVTVIAAMAIRVAFWYSPQSSDLSPEDLGDVYAELVLRMLNAGGR